MIGLAVDGILVDTLIEFSFEILQFHAFCMTFYYIKNLTNIEHKTIMIMYTLLSEL